jgi:arginine-tRNA-protein transferase
MELFLAAGYRRNGNCLYAMRCMDCSRCLPIRLHPAEFRPNRNQKRTWQRNSDLTTQLLPLEATEEDIALCDKFLRSRYPMKHNSGASYYHDFFLNNIVNSARLQFRLNGQLIGTSIIDVGYNWLNAVYFYFDPDQSHRSLGTYNILSLIDLCREWEIEFLYLGYLIRSVSAMSYKSKFRPYYLYEDEDWIPCLE